MKTFKITGRGTIAKKVTNTKNDPKVDWLMGGNPKAIENQEADGQEELVNSLQLPKKCNSPHRLNAVEEYHKMGIKVFTGSKGDDLFVGTKLPEGWKKEATDHSMWNNLVDDKERIRASIFYKAAFYDREAFINFNQAINFRVDREMFLEGNYDREDGDYKGYKSPYVGRVTRYDGKVLFETEKYKCDVTYKKDVQGSGYTEKYKKTSESIIKQLREECLAFLNENYPDYLNIHSYWD